MFSGPDLRIGRTGRTGRTALQTQELTPVNNRHLRFPPNIVKSKVLVLLVVVLVSHIAEDYLLKLEIEIIAFHRGNNTTHN